jgi:hypothetical protein
MWRNLTLWRITRALLAVLAVAFVRAPLAPAAEIPEGLARCADVADNLERLTCYDRQNPPRRAGAVKPDADFGANDELMRKRQADGVASAAARGPDRITAKVTRISVASTGDTLVELDNGQVWQQTQSRLETIAALGDEVTVSRGALGSYFMVSKSRLSTRVKRVK